MNKEKIKNLNEVIKEIENCSYIDCHEDEIFDDYQYENILYYLKQLKKQQEINKKAIEYIKEKQKIQYKFALSHIECDDLLEILEDKEKTDINVGEV